MYNSIRIFTGFLLLIIAFSKLGFLPSGVTREWAFTPEGWTFIQAVDATGYLFPAVGVVALLCGLAFLSNRYVATAAIILMTITVNFALFHIFLGFRELSIREAISYVPLLLNLYIIYCERRKYASLFKS